MLLDLMPHQVKTSNFAVSNPYSLNCLDAGLGKSSVALDVWEKTGGNLLIICPSYLVLNWIKEIRKFLGDSPVVTPIRKGKEIYDLLDTDIAIISYDLAIKAENLFEWADMIIADECQNLKNMEAKRTASFHKNIFENNIKRLSLLTGTPIQNRVAEYYSLLCLMYYRPGIKSDFLEKFPSQITFSDHFSFRHEFKMPVWKHGKRIMATVVNWTGHRNVEELKKYLKPFYIRFKSEDILDLPDTLEKEYHISDSDDLELLREFKEYFGKKVQEKHGNKIRLVAKNASVKSNYKAKAALKKAPFTVQYVKNLLEEVDSVVIYTDHVDSCEDIARGLGVKPITGKIQAPDRFRISNDFQSGKTKVLVATIKSFSTGIDLTRSCNLVFNDIPWVPGEIHQAIHRIRRLTQKRNPVVHFVYGSVQDRIITKSLTKKSETIEACT